MLPYEVQSYDFAFTHATIGMALISPGGTILKVNSALYELLGYDPNEVYSSFLPHFIEEIIAELVPISELLQCKEINRHQFEQFYNHPSGTLLSLDISISVILDVNKDPLHYFVQFENKTMLRQMETELHYAESNLHKKEDSFQQLIERLPLSVLITNHGVIKYVNPAGLQLVFAKSLDEVLGMSTNQIVDTSSHSALSERRKKFYNKNADGSVRYLIHCLNGQQKYVEGFSLHVTYQGQPAVVGIFKDISEQKVEEERVMQSEKLSTAGQLAAGIAHEIRNPLTAINGFMKLLRSSDGKNDKYFSIIESELKRIEFIVNELLVLSKPQTTHTSSPLHLIPLLDQVITLMNVQAALKNIEILPKYPEKQIILINGVTNQLKQVFINLFKNAMESMTHGGNIHIHIQTSENEVRISVQDEGCGMTEEEVKTLGSPFYTTKDTGTGLGFIITHNIVHNHGGAISVNSIPQQGTTFTVSLPIISVADEADM
ncbi:PAS domain-containing sensor histidine kinase [Paenibacillus sp. Marseille-Q4541]|uniref:PAS domain-containing sensor histidine kinase n=1 Tax=Paenibacillus sp. Marseille-Q4541 TaxID=2831522 RepID=UPI001BA91A60